MTIETVRFNELTEGKLPLVRIAVAGSAIVSLPAGIRLTEGGEILLFFAETGVAVLAFELVVRSIQGEAAAGVQLKVDRGLGTREGFMNSRMAMSTGAFFG